MDQLPAAIQDAISSHTAYELPDATYASLTTTKLDSIVTASALSNDETSYIFTLEVRAPMLSAATDDSVGDAIESGWFETYARRVEDVTMSTRESIELDSLVVENENGTAVVQITIQYDHPERGLELLKTFAEFVEGTYLEGIVPGYSYKSPVADLLSSARKTAGSEDEDRGPMPL